MKSHTRNLGETAQYWLEGEGCRATLGLPGFHSWDDPLGPGTEPWVPGCFRASTSNKGASAKPRRLNLSHLFLILGSVWDSMRQNCWGAPLLRSWFRWSQCVTDCLIVEVGAVWDQNVVINISVSTGCQGRERIMVSANCSLIPLAKTLPFAENWAVLCPVAAGRMRHNPFSKGVYSLIRDGNHMHSHSSPGQLHWSCVERTRSATGGWRGLSSRHLTGLTQQWRVWRLLSVAFCFDIS